MLLVNPETRLFLILFVAIIKAQSDTEQYRDSLEPYQLQKLFTIDLASRTDVNIISIKFQVLNEGVLSPTGLFIASEIKNLGIQMTDLYSKSPMKIVECDLDAMWDFRTQYLNIKKQPELKKLYLKLSNFDNFRRYNYREYALEYRISLKYSNASICGPCENGGIDSNNDCICECPELFSGKYCTRQIINKELSNFQVQLLPLQIQFYRLPPSRAFLSTMINSSYIQLYCQYETFQYQVATYYNIGYMDKRNARYEIIFHDTFLTFQYQNFTNSILFTVANPTTQSVKVTINLEDLQASTLPYIITVSGIGFIIIVIGITCFIRRRNQSQIHVSNFNFMNEMQLNKNQLERYYPSCRYSLLESVSIDISSIELEKKQENVCTICIENIKSSELIKIGYCKHFFHEVCLMEWFQKQKICPYCRFHFNRQESLKAYQNLCVSLDKKQLEGEQLIISIFKSKPFRAVDTQDKIKQ